MKISALQLGSLAIFLTVLRYVTATVSSCSYQEDQFNSIIQSGKAVNVFYFANDTKETIQLTWAGENSGILILVTMTEGKLIPGMASDVYRSDNNGKTFTNITHLFGERVYIRRDNGLQRHHHQRDSKELFVICFNKTEKRHSIIFVTTDGGLTWEKSNVPFVLSGLLRFYPKKRLSPWILTLEESTSTLFLSLNSGKTWTMVHENVVDYFWSIYEVDALETFYVLHRPDGTSKNNSNQILLKTSNFGQTWVKLMDRVLRVWAPRGLYSQSPSNPDEDGLREVNGTNRHSSFLYVAHTVDEDNATTRLSVSTNGGHLFRPVNLPDVQPERFFSVLEVEDDAAFIHVDAPNDTGFGTLYTSDHTGRVFSESLQHHLFPNHAHVTDFYRIASMRGTYLATRLNPDRTLHTVISHDRGASWRPLGPPSNMQGACKTEAKSSIGVGQSSSKSPTDGDTKSKKTTVDLTDHSENVQHESVTGETWAKVNSTTNTSKSLSSVKVCGLQVSNQFSIRHHVVASPPMSIPAAPGLILVHGHVGTHLKNTPADVFVSSDGGYSWRKALDGPHHYHIANRGGLIVAVPAHTLWPDTLKFSTDEGQCWHTVPLRSSGQSEATSPPPDNSDLRVAVEATGLPWPALPTYGRNGTADSSVEEAADLRQQVRTKEKVVFTGLVTEPGGRAMAVAVYGYGTVSQRWRVAVVDFQANGIVRRKCNEDDYDLWVAHASVEGGNEGCLLGMRETYRKLKKGSLCENEYGLDPMLTIKSCPCTQLDFECEYGYHREMGSLECVLNRLIPLPDNICQLFEDEADQVHYLGYRRIPGDLCVGGWQPPFLNETLSRLIKQCGETGNESVQSRIPMATVLVVSFLLLGLLVAASYCYFRRRRQNSTFRFLHLNNTDQSEAGSMQAEFWQKPLWRRVLSQAKSWKQPSLQPRISFQHSSSFTGQTVFWPKEPTLAASRGDARPVENGVLAPTNKATERQMTASIPADSGAKSAPVRSGHQLLAHIKPSFEPLLRTTSRGYHHLNSSNYLDEANLLDTDELDYVSEGNNMVLDREPSSEVRDPLSNNP